MRDHRLIDGKAVQARRADVVALGQPHFLGADMIKPGAAVINIGINQIVDEAGNTRLVGDVDTDAVLEIAGGLRRFPAA